MWNSAEDAWVDYPEGETAIQVLKDFEHGLEHLKHTVDSKGMETSFKGFAAG